MQAIQVVMSAIAEQINLQTGLRCQDVVPNKLNPPEVFLHLTSAKPGTFGMDSHELQIDVIAFVSSAVDRAQHELYELVATGTTRSLFDALAVDPSFGISGVSSASGEFRNLDIDEIAAYSMYGGAISLAVSIS